MKIIWLTSPATINVVVDNVALPAEWNRFIVAPWTALTYMFIHIDLWHMVVNCLWLLWFGAMLNKMAGWRWVLVTYFAGGIFGAISYLTLGAISSTTSGTCLLGASAATLAVSASTLICVPNKKVKIPFIGTFTLKWVAAVGFVLLALTSIEMTTAQTVAHAGGIIAGGLCAIIWRIISRKRMNRIKIMAKQRMTHLTLVEKARRSGYASLTRDEQIQLFNTSKQNISNSATPQ